MKCELLSGVTYYTDGDVCTDINVTPDIKSVTLMHPIVNIDRNTCKKEYPNVEELVIKDNVTFISIPNRMFPNIKKISSKSRSFSSGEYLIERFGNKLLNAFGQSEYKQIDFSLFERITDYAFEGCKAREICNYDGSKYMSFAPHAFDDSGFLERSFVNGLKKIGPLVVDIDGDADEIVIPDEKLVFAVQKNVKCVRIKCMNNFNPSKTLTEKVIIEDERVKYDDIVRDKLRYYGINEIESRIPRYKTVDGIIYSADMTTLMTCPQMKTGKVVIPEGVKRIRKAAFSGSKISGVVLPDSLEKIDDEAFYGCENLEDIDFGHGLERIGENGCRNMFAGCAISKLVLPPQIKKIGIAAFYCCHKLTELVLNEGLEEIEACAFVYCTRLAQVTLPKSIKKIGKSAFVWPITQDGVYADVNVQISSIPKDFIFGFVKQDVALDAKTSICVHLKNRTEDFKFVLPDAIRPNSNYSKINFALNDFENHPELSKKVLNKGFLMAPNAKSVDVVAYKTYKLTKGQKAKEFIRDNSDDIAFSLAKMMPEEDFIDFVKLDFVKLRYNEKLMELLRENEWTTGLAYMLEATEPEEKSELKNFAI